MTLQRILLTGGSGQVGTCLQLLQWPETIALDAPSSDILDLANPSAIQAFLGQNTYAAIINCGAYTAVDKAENEEALAIAVNGEAPRQLAEYAKNQDIPLLHVSTDYVFDGTKSSAYLEDDTVNPLGVYGRSKLAGEQAVIASKAQAVILRTAWVLSPHGHNFLKTMVRLGEERENLSVVDDQIGNPTSAHDIATAIYHISQTMLNDPKISGIYHFVNDGETSWHGLASYIFASLATKGSKTPQLSAIPSSEYPTPARRPSNSRLATDKIATDFGLAPRKWQDAVDHILTDLGC